MLVEAFTVTENIILGSEPTHGGILDRKSEKEIEEVSTIRVGCKSQCLYSRYFCGYATTG